MMCGVIPDPRTSGAVFCCEQEAGICACIYGNVSFDPIGIAGHRFPFLRVDSDVFGFRHPVMREIVEVVPDKGSRRLDQAEALGRLSQREIPGNGHLTRPWIGCLRPWREPSYI